MRRTLLASLLSIVLLPDPSSAQVPSGGCGSGLRPEDVPLYEEAQRSRRDVDLHKAGYWYFVPITFHIVRPSNGVGGLTPSEVVFVVDQLNQDFAGLQVLFYPAGPARFIDDDDFYWNIDSDAEIDALRAVDSVPGTINVYFVEELANDDGAIGGISSFTWRSSQGIVVRNANTFTRGNPSTMTHEVGHYFDLLHTHETARGVECADGSNCLSAGDEICDTPADPKLGSLTVVDCAYVGTEVDSCNNETYAPLTNNFMSYAPSECRYDFTTTQELRALITLIADRPDHVTVRWTSSSAVFVDGQASGLQVGSMHFPYDTVQEGVDLARSGGSGLVIVADGSYGELLTLSEIDGDVTVVATAAATVRVGD